VRYAQKQGKRSFFIKLTTVLRTFVPVGHPRDTILGQPRYLAAPQGCQEVQNGKTAA
jgi:hypothetical protein